MPDVDTPSTRYEIETGERNHQQGKEIKRQNLEAERDAKFEVSPFSVSCLIA